MRTSIVIPVWNGASVLPGCLESVYAHSGDELLEVICVDNASGDGSADLIAGRFPQVRLLRQLVNLGFAGGVNTGIEAAEGDLFVLLNQDCVVHAGWLRILCRVLEQHPEYGIAGCTVLEVDGRVNHAGAMVRRPDAHSVHLVEVGASEPKRVDFVTGAVFAIRRRTWEVVGRFDEGYYPAYYEDADYCYRARRHGLEIAYVPEAEVTHLFSSEAWQADTVKHAANQHLARYRFVCKHFDVRELGSFFQAEREAIEAEEYFDRAVGRATAARSALRGLPDILEHRRLDLDDSPSPAQRRQIQVGLAQVLRWSLDSAERLIMVGLVEPPIDEWQAGNRELQEVLEAPFPGDLPVEQQYRDGLLKLQDLRQRELDVFARIYYLPSEAERPESRLRRWFRLLVLRPISAIIGRDNLLLSELNALHIARMDHMSLLMQQMEEAYRARLDQLIHRQNARIELYNNQRKQEALLARHHRERLERRLQLLEALTDYDYR